MSIPREKAIELVLKANKKLEGAIRKVMLWDESLSTMKLAKKMNVHTSEIYRMEKAYGLLHKKIPYKLSSLKTNMLVRNRMILRLRTNDKLSFESIGRAFNLSKQRVEQIFQNEISKKLNNGAK